ncbi:hypothetical protein LDENG_00193530 [Lucifuga dentata]|nr:hypothetical protein LDENG_00193530 [Lucifuga dentata]
MINRPKPNSWCMEPTLLYRAESWITYTYDGWITYGRHLKALEQHYQQSLRRILRMKKKGRHINPSVLKEANMTSITITIM